MNTRATHTRNGVGPDVDGALHLRQVEVPLRVAVAHVDPRAGPSPVPPAYRLALPGRALRLQHRLLRGRASPNGALWGQRCGGVGGGGYLWDRSSEEGERGNWDTTRQPASAGPQIQTKLQPFRAGLPDKRFLELHFFDSIFFLNFFIFG